MCQLFMCEEYRSIFCAEPNMSIPDGRNNPVAPCIAGGASDTNMIPFAIRRDRVKGKRVCRIATNRAGWWFSRAQGNPRRAITIFHNVRRIIIPLPTLTVRRADTTQGYTRAASRPYGSNDIKRHSRIADAYAKISAIRLQRHITRTAPRCRSCSNSCGSIPLPDQNSGRRRWSKSERPACRISSSKENGGRWIKNCISRSKKCCAIDMQVCCRGGGINANSSATNRNVACAFYRRSPIPCHNARGSGCARRRRSFIKRRQHLDPLRQNRRREKNKCRANQAQPSNGG